VQPESRAFETIGLKSRLGARERWLAEGLPGFWPALFIFLRGQLG
jgi:hypothetical protein